MNKVSIFNAKNFLSRWGQNVMHIGSKAGSNDVFRIPTQAMRSSVHLSRLYTRGIHPSWPDAKCTLLNSFERRMLWCPRWSLAATDICPEASGKGRKCTERVKHGRLVILNRIYSGGCLVVQMGWMTILHAASRKRQYSGNLAETGQVKEFWWSEYCFKKSNWKWLKDSKWMRQKFQGRGRGDKQGFWLGRGGKQAKGLSGELGFKIIPRMLFFIIFLVLESDNTGGGGDHWA